MSTNEIFNEMLLGYDITTAAKAQCYLRGQPADYSCRSLQWWLFQ